VGRLDDYERALMNEAGDQLGALSVARSATEALELALEGAHLEAVHGTPSPSYYLRRAILLLSALALRTARATLLVVAAGYEPERTGSSADSLRSTSGPKPSPPTSRASTRETGSRARARAHRES